MSDNMSYESSEASYTCGDGIGLKRLRFMGGLARFTNFKYYLQIVKVVKHSIRFVNVGDLTNATLAEVQAKITTILAMDKLGRTDAANKLYDRMVASYELDAVKLKQMTREIVVQGRWPDIVYHATDSIPPNLLPRFEEGTGRIMFESYMHTEIK